MFLGSFLSIKELCFSDTWSSYKNLCCGIKVIIQDGYKLYESQIILSKEDIGLQNNITGWIVPEKKNDLISIISKFNKYKYPFLIIK